MFGLSQFSSRLIHEHASEPRVVGAVRLSGARCSPFAWPSSRRSLSEFQLPSIVPTLSCKFSGTWL